MELFEKGPDPRTFIRGGGRPPGNFAFLVFFSNVFENLHIFYVYKLKWPNEVKRVVGVVKRGETKFWESAFFRS